MKILYIKDKGCNIKYFNSVVSHIRKKNIFLRKIDLKTFAKKSFYYDEDFTIIYQTFPGETSSEKRFKSELVERADLKFLKLKNKNKILFDAHDNGIDDAFSRFINLSNYTIKNKLL